jgi:hypothetical protein
VPHPRLSCELASATQQISTHWLRHTTLTWVERNVGYATARAYAGHNDTGNDAGTTATYVRATLPKIAAQSPRSPANPTHSPKQCACARPASTRNT